MSAPAISVDRRGERSRVLLGRVSRARELGIIIAIVLVVTVTTFKNHGFISGPSIRQVLAGTSLIALLAVGETLVIITRNVDLSIGSVLGLSAYLVGYQFVHHPGTPQIVVYALGIGIGIVCGAVNGLITTALRVPSLVVTLATLYIIRGIDAVISHGKQIDPTAIPDSFQKIGFRDTWNIPWLAMLVAVVIAVVAFAMRAYRPSRDLYAIGSNPTAARLAGIPSGKRVLTAFVISGGLAGLGGVLFLAEFATVASTAGTGYEFLVVAAVVVGGVAIFGGSGTVLGAALGALLLNTINQALVAAGVSAFWNLAIAGALLLGAIAFDRFVALRVNRALRVEGSASR
ncbi:MAG: inner-rane translocator [Frankiales bacterium]|nr:inner-rane translocator [Frankiales bacterium]